MSYSVHNLSDYGHCKTAHTYDKKARTEPRITGKDSVGGSARVYAILRCPKSWPEK